MKFKSGLCIVLLLFVAGIRACSACKLVRDWLIHAGISPPGKCDDEPSETGPCKAAFQMWRFIRERRLCESFIYGGCQATENIFELEAECRQQCLG